jgi:hypothetical protein
MQAPADEWPTEKCFGKVCYPDKKAAVTKLNTLKGEKSRKRKTTDKMFALRAYDCNLCNCWHLTKQTVDKFAATIIEYEE